ncbi:MAG: histidine phosphatase family protein [Tateyamaria sp.]
MLRYLSHPQVQIDPDVPITEWPLNAVGRARMHTFSALAPTLLARTKSVYSSPERKARDAADIVAGALNLNVTIAAQSYENDRSATGYLPSAEFEATADAFFAHPNQSARGWERAVDAQTRILSCVKQIAASAPDGDILVVGHGAVGTLLFCAARAVPIDRAHDQGPGGGGNLIVFERENLGAVTGWTPIEAL